MHFNWYVLLVHGNYSIVCILTSSYFIVKGICFHLCYTDTVYTLLTGQLVAVLDNTTGTTLMVGWTSWEMVALRAGPTSKQEWLLHKNVHMDIMFIWSRQCLCVILLAKNGYMDGVVHHSLRPGLDGTWLFKLDFNFEGNFKTNHNESLGKSGIVLGASC